MLLNRLRSSFGLYVKKGTFLNHFLVLSSGTVLGQLISVLASPLLTRLYSPADFGLFALFTAMVSTFTPAVCGKYEIALIVPKSNDHGKHLLGIAIYFALFISIILFVVMLITGDTILSFLHTESLGKWSFVVPAALFITGLFNAVSYFSNRQKNYTALAQSRIFRNIVCVTVTVAGGLLAIGFSGLLLGYMVSALVAAIFLIYKNYTKFSPLVMRLESAKTKIFYQYADYPLYNATTGLLNGLALTLPVFFLSRYFPENIVGYFAIVGQMSQKPLDFISYSVSQIHLKKTADLINQKKPITPYLFKLTFVLVAVVALPTLTMIFWGPNIFSFILGNEWRVAGGYAQIMMSAIAAGFVVSTLSGILEVTKNNELIAYWRTTKLVTTLIVLSYFSRKGDIILLLYAMAINDIILYIFYYKLIVTAAKKLKNFELCG